MTSATTYCDTTLLRQPPLLHCTDGGAGGDWMTGQRRPWERKQSTVPKPTMNAMSEETHTRLQQLLGSRYKQSQASSKQEQQCHVHM